MEEQFYLLMPIFLLLTRNNKQRVLILLCIILSITFIVRPFSSDNIFLTQNRADGLMYGCLLYYLTIQPWFLNVFLGKQVKRHYAILITSILLFTLISITAIGFSNAVVIPLACLIATLLVGLASLERNIIIFLPGTHNVLNYIGLRSYSIYIVHFPMMTFTQELMYRLSYQYKFPIDKNLGWLYTIIFLALTFFISEITYRFIEVPFIAKGKKISQNSQESSTEKLGNRDGGTSGSAPAVL